MIDFAHVRRPGPALLDYVSLETAIRLALLTTVNVDTWYKVEKRLAETTDPKAVEYEDLAFEEQKAVRAICAIRDCAYLANHSASSYRTALVCHGVTQLTTYDPEAPYTHRELIPYLSYVLAAAIYSGERPTIRRVLIDTRLGIIQVDDEQERRLPGGLDQEVLIYLAERAREVCTYEAIITAVWPELADQVFDMAWMQVSGKPMVQARVNSLRGAYQWPSSSPIVSEWGKGYKFQVEDAELK